MNSLKTTIVCVVLLGVLYGMYQVINTPSPDLSEDVPPVAEIDGERVDPADILGSFYGDSDDATGAALGEFEPPSFDDGPSPSINSPVDDYNSGNRNTENLALQQPDSNLGSPGGLGNGSMSPGPSQLSPNGDNSNGAPNAPLYPNNPPGLTQPSSGISGSQVSSPQSGELRAPDSGSVSRTPGQGDSPLDRTGGDQAVTRKLADTWNEVDSLIEKSRYQEALALLSSYHDDPALTPSERENLQTWLDALAAKVIYSMEHHLEIPYTVKSQDTMERIAGEYQVPPTLLYNINRERIDNNGWTPGIELKVVPGPFHAVVNLRAQKLTLWLNDMYAGSFPIRLGNDQNVLTGDYMVASKSDVGRSYVPLSGSPINGMNAGNPYGQYLIDIGKGVLIHGTPGGLAAHDGKGGIAMEEKHAQDVYEILSRASEVRITR